jgi:ferrous iron transport protein A
MSTTPQTLSQLARGESARVVAVAGGGSMAVRLLEMGLTPGTMIQLVKRAPFGDPLEVRVRGCHVSLRAAEAAQVRVMPESTPA